MRTRISGRSAAPMAMASADALLLLFSWLRQEHLAPAVPAGAPLGRLAWRGSHRDLVRASGADERVQPLGVAAGIDLRSHVHGEFSERDVAGKTGHSRLPSQAS